MLVTFKTDSHADITKFGEVALTTLKMMGHSATLTGAILAADVAEALIRLTAALHSQNSAPGCADQDKEGAEPAVSIAHRALPLIDLLTAASKAKSDVMWK